MNLNNNLLSKIKLVIGLNVFMNLEIRAFL